MNYYERILQHALTDSVDILKLTQKLCQRAIDDGIPGDFAEAGVAYGVHGIIMKDIAVKQKVILFDSFEGISVHGAEDKEWVEHYGESEADPRKSGGVTVAKLEHTQETMLKFLPTLNGIEFRKGWFVDTFPLIPEEERYAVLRLDCDLYAPYRLCFEYLWPRVSVGGWMIIDDWNLSGCRQAAEEYGFNPDDFLILRDNAYINKIK